MVNETYVSQVERLKRFLCDELPGGLPLVQKSEDDSVSPVDIAIKLLRERVVAADVPVFVLKGTDLIAPQAVEHYHEMCHSYGLFAQQEEVGKALEEMRDWQDRNRDRVKLPDHKHAPHASVETHSPGLSSSYKGPFRGPK